MKKRFMLSLVFTFLASTAAGCGDTITNYYGDQKADSDESTDRDPVTDNTENTQARCSDALDNDNNGKADCDDPNCAQFSFCAKAEDGQENTLAACSDESDNDGDGKTDCDDSDCQAFMICQAKEAENTEEKCKDGLDNDGDGNIDCEDSECKGFSACTTTKSKAENTVETCIDGEDNDGDGKIDCADEGCSIFGFCDGSKGKEGAENTVELCTDGVDNDGDNALDCLDSECWKFDVCGIVTGIVENSRELCSDGEDNDYNGTKDCDDPNCAILDICRVGGSAGENTYALCSDKIDSDGDGKTDCDDPECKLFDICLGKTDKDDCPDDPYTYIKDGTCACGETNVDGICYKNITTAEELLYIDDGGNYILKQDLDLGETSDRKSVLFRGTLLGENHRITGILHQSKEVTGCGLFSDISDSTIKDLDISITVNCSNNKPNIDVGALAGTANNSKFSHISGSSKLLLDYDSKLGVSDMGFSVNAGGLIGKAKQSEFSNLSIRGNATSKLTYKVTGSDIYPESAETVNVGGIIGLMQETSMNQVNANMNVTANFYFKKNDYYTIDKSRPSSKYLFPKYRVGGIVGYTSGNMSHISNRGTVKAMVNRPPFEEYYNSTYKEYGRYLKQVDTSLGGIVGTTDANVKLNAINMDGTIESHGSAAHLTTDVKEGSSSKYYYYGVIITRIGGILGSGSGCTLSESQSDIELIAEDDDTVYAGGIAGSVADSTLVSNIAKTKLVITDSSVSPASRKFNFGGAVGDSVGVKLTTDDDSQTHILNNHLNIIYDFDNFTSLTPVSDMILSNSVGNIEKSVVTNNFITGKIINNDNKNYPTPWSVSGDYVYETYWNSDVFGNHTKGTHIDASSKPYQWNVNHIAVTSAKESILGLLRYNSGHDGGVLSTNLPKNLKYADWETSVDDEKHILPIPAI